MSMRERSVASSDHQDGDVDAQILIVGAGPTGLTLACDLARRGVEAEGPDREHWHVWPYAQGGMVGLCPLPGSRLDIGAGPSTRPGGSSGAPAEGGGTGSLGGRDGRRAEWSLGPSPLRLGADG
jgi:FAD binding domain